jgi:hypothetical protein
LLWVQNGNVLPASVEDEVGMLMDLGALDVKERLAAGKNRVVVLTEDEPADLSPFFHPSIARVLA